jgi:UDP-N-acetylmuramyl pentapeptide phosphotransferase/UDP-N-acetylglucosamine-1-phosphate transferase
MIVFVISMLAVAYLSLVTFQTMNLGVLNYEGKYVPYSLGVVIIYSFAFVYAFPPQANETLSFSAFLFVFSIWLLGLIDDIYGKPYPKGLKGHIMHAIGKGIITTGLMKAVGTVGVAILFLWMNQPISIFPSFVGFCLLTGLPHVMNLFDTRPLRVWKVAVCMTIFVLIVNPLPSFVFIVMLLSVFYVLYVLEGYKKAMLGDNGATLIGAILAVIILNHISLMLQIILLFIVVLFIALAEKYSFSKAIEKSSFLRRIDQLGVLRK